MRERSSYQTSLCYFAPSFLCAAPELTERLEEAIRSEIEKRVEIPLKFSSVKGSSNKQRHGA